MAGGNKLHTPKEKDVVTFCIARPLQEIGINENECPQ